jgi:hypothetical protein
MYLWRVDDPELMKSGTKSSFDTHLTKTGKFPEAALMINPPFTETSR